MLCVLAFAGCAENPEPISNTDTKIPTTEKELNSGTEDSSGSNNSSINVDDDISVPEPVPPFEIFFVEYGKTQQWSYLNETGTISVEESGTDITVAVRTEGQIKTIKHNQSDNARTERWTNEDLRFAIVPIKMKQDKIEYVDTWNATHVRLRVACVEECEP